MGVNLPAHLVVVKNTAQWQGKAKGYGEMSASNMLQMIGRAGRPGLDDHGVAVIMTHQRFKSRYDQLTQGREVVESTLLEHLGEALNCEVCNQVVQSVEDAVAWVRGSFLFVRLRKNPQKYGLPQAADHDPTCFLNEKVSQALQELVDASICDFSADGLWVTPLKASFIMCR